MKQLSEEAQRLLPGGVNSPVRAFKAVGGLPPIIARGSGSRLWDTEGHEYLDYIGAYGPAILGHADPKVVTAIQEAATHGFSYGMTTELEVRLAQMVCQIYSSIEKIRFVNSGTEATMSAIRLARGFTKRDKIIKFEGNYHGHADFLLVEAGSGAATFGHPSSAGVPKDFARQTLVATYNDLNSVENLFEKNKNEIASLIVEPVAGNIGCVPPAEGFLQGLRELCTTHGALLIFDEVMTGFRVGLGGAQQLYQIKPDLTCLGKIIGGGLPVGAFGGRKEIMDLLAPSGPVYQAGTLSGNPLTMTAGIKTIEQLVHPGVYERLNETTQMLVSGIRAIAVAKKIPVQVQSVGSMWTLFFNDQPVTNFATAKQCNLDRFKKFFHACLAGGLLLPPSQFESAFVSLAHSPADIDATLAIVQKGFNCL